MKGLSKFLVLSSFFLAGCGQGLIVADVTGGDMQLRADDGRGIGGAASTLRADPTYTPNDTTREIRFDDEIRGVMLAVLSRFPTRGELEYLRTRIDDLGSSQALRAELAGSTEALRHYRTLSCLYFNSCDERAVQENFAMQLANGVSLIELHRKIEINMVASIEALYREHLGRRADFEGLTYYLEQGRAGLSLAKIEDSIRRSEEAQLRGFYLQILRREPDAGGFRYWLDRRAAGMTLRDIQRSIQASEEAQGRAPASAAVVAAQNVVRDEFLGVTGRFPTVDEVRQYTGTSAANLRTRLVATIDGQAQLNAILARHFGGDSTADRGSITNLLLTGKSRTEIELGLRRERQDIIAAAYLQHLNRAPDLLGLNYYLAQAEAGRSRAQIETDIRYSVEAQLRGFYLELLRREPDLMGLLYYFERVEAGMSLEAIRENIGSSEEFRSL